MYLGIDLAASKRNKTGLAFFNLCSFECFSVCSDEEIVEAARKAKIIAVDAPLTFGRVYRKADLAVKFAKPLPLSLPSMKKLMERGIKLRETLEGSGKTVIESFTNALRKLFEVKATQLAPCNARNKHERDACFLAFLAFLHKYELTVNKHGMHLPREEAVIAVKRQVNAMKKFREEDVREHSLLAGVDVHYKQGIAIGVAINEKGEKAVIYEKVMHRYVPTLFSLREFEPAVKALRRISFDVAVVNAVGIAHPRAGLATEIGVALDKPSIGVTKSLLCGKLVDNKILYKNKEVGIAWKKQFLTLGYRVNIESLERLKERAVKIIKKAHRLASIS